MPHRYQKHPRQPQFHRASRLRPSHEQQHQQYPNHLCPRQRANACNQSMGMRTGTIDQFSNPSFPELAQGCVGGKSSSPAGPFHRPVDFIACVHIVCQIGGPMGNRATVCFTIPNEGIPNFYDLRDRIFLERRILIQARREAERTYFEKKPWEREPA